MGDYDDEAVGYDDDEFLSYEELVEKSLAESVEREQRAQQSQRDSEFWKRERAKASALPEDPAEARSADLLAWARGETDQKISLKRANELGGPDNPKVAEMAKRGMVEGWEAPAGKPLITDGAKQRYEEALKLQETKLEAQKKAEQEKQEQRKDPMGYATRKALERIRAQPNAHEILADAEQRDWERRTGLRVGR
ncbi:MAG: hypothetical protein WEB06_19555 [Actinomycetota bacterium]